jgi:predicted RNA binding protein YcfA (HicA-like mRNA interferase family)
MPKLGPVSQGDLIRRFRRLGFEGPVSGGKHPYMIRGTHTVTVPNPHRGVIDPSLLARILKQAGIQREEWERSA